MAIGGTKVVQVTNIAPQATKDQMQTLFGYLGKIEDIRLYPTIRDVSCPVQSRICYIKFIETTTVGIAQHMTNTVFIDRALIVIPVQSGEIPDEYFALEMTRNGTIVPGLCPSEPNLPPNVINTVTNLGSGHVILTYDPKLESSGLPQYPPLPSSYDSHKIEEIRRTVMLVNIDMAIPTDDYIHFFAPVAEVKYMRQCTKNADSETHMLVEFSDQPSIVEVLKLNGKELKGKPINIIHATQAIVKPQAKSNEAAQKEIEEAMSRVKEAQNLISATIDPVIGMLSKDKRSSRRSRSRSRGRRRRSRSRSRRSRSHHRSRRSRSKSRDRKRRSKSPSRRRSRSHSRRSGSHSRSSKTRKSRSKSRSKTSRRHKSKDRAKSIEKSKDKERSGRSRDRDKSKERDRKSKDNEKERESKEKRSDRDLDVEEKRKKRSRSHSRGKFRSRSRERKRSKSRDKRSRSRGRRRTPSPRLARRRSRSKSKDREHKRDKRDKREKKERSPSLPKTSRNYDEEERGYDSERSRRKDYGDSYETDNPLDKDSSEKSDNMDISNSP